MATTDDVLLSREIVGTGKIDEILVLRFSDYI